MMASILPMMKMRKRVLEGQLSETNDRIAQNRQMIAENDRLIAEIEKRGNQ